MKPTLNHNDFVFAYKTKKIQANDIVIAQPDKKTLIIKRIKRMNSDSVIFSSDNKKTNSNFSDIELKRNFQILKVFLVFRLPLYFFFL